MALPEHTLRLLNVPLAQSKPHDLNKSDLETKFNLTALTPAQRGALLIPLPEFGITSVANVLINHNLTALKPLMMHSTTSLRRFFKVEALAASLNSAGGRTLIDDFFSNTAAKKEIDYAPGSTVSDLVKGHDRFKVIALDFEKLFVQRYQSLLTSKRASVDVENLQFEFARNGGALPAPRMPFFGIGDPLAILGSFQQFDVRLVAWNDGNHGDYEAILQYELYDHFGCDDSDLVGLPTHGTPGQIAMWLLARQPQHGPGHKPFVVKIRVLREVTGVTRI